MIGRTITAMLWNRSKIIRYDTVGLLGWSSAIGNHLIKTVIAKLLAEDSDKMVAKKVKKGKPHALVRAVPEAVDEDVDCQDCFKWEIADFRGPAKPVAVMIVATGPNVTGANTTLMDTVPLNGDCHNFPAEFQDNISSARTTAVARCGLFTDLNCVGQETFINPGQAVNFVAPFNDTLSSYLCVNA
ncbi:hypothetical protein C8J56DRAFT_1173978 [Mycena floridula]|nr:hypothetical protein C8J56DRAFT_1173978 [Mycena floridula]